MVQKDGKPYIGKCIDLKNIYTTQEDLLHILLSIFDCHRIAIGVIYVAQRRLHLSQKMNISDKITFKRVTFLIKRTGNRLYSNISISYVYLVLHNLNSFIYITYTLDCRHVVELLMVAVLYT